MRLSTTVMFAYGQDQLLLEVMIAAALLVTQAICATTGSVAGVIKDTSGAPVTGARVTLTNSGTGIKQNVTSGKNGSYRFPNVLPGEYELHGEAKNFKPQSRTGLMVHVDSAIRIDLTLEAEDSSAH